MRLGVDNMKRELSREDKILLALLFAMALVSIVGIVFCVKWILAPEVIAGNGIFIVVVLGCICIEYLRRAVVDAMKILGM